MPGAAETMPCREAAPPRETAVGRAPPDRRSMVRGQAPEPGTATMAEAGVTGGPMPGEAVLARTLVELADTLVADFDLVDFLTLLTDGCVEVLGVGAAG